MFKHLTILTAAAAVAVVMLPAASQAGGHHARDARSSCAITKMFERATRHTERAARTVVNHGRAERVWRVRSTRSSK